MTLSLNCAISTNQSIGAARIFAAGMHLLVPPNLISFFFVIIHVILLSSQITTHTSPDQ